MQCRLCGREASSFESEALCRYHRRAMDTLKQGYKTWSSAYSGISWTEYLNIVKTLEDTGQWIREVIVMEEAKC